jgi:hypothetical protein
MLVQLVFDMTGQSMKLTNQIQVSRGVQFLGKAAALSLSSLNI